MEDFHQMNIPPKRGTAFLQMFARFEYSLKASSEFAEGDAKEIRAAWDKFANAIDGAFRAIADKSFQESVQFLLAAPARKQGMMGFQPLVIDPAQTEAQRTLLVIRTVRNNVIHGGKNLATE